MTVTSLTTMQCKCICVYIYVINFDSAILNNVTWSAYLRSLIKLHPHPTQPPTPNPTPTPPPQKNEENMLNF